MFFGLWLILIQRLKITPLWSSTFLLIGQFLKIWINILNHWLLVIQRIRINLSFHFSSSILYRSLSFTSLRFWVSLASSLTIYHTHTHTHAIDLICFFLPLQFLISHDSLLTTNQQKIHGVISLYNKSTQL